MKGGRILYGALIFAGGLGLGFWIGRAPPGAFFSPPGAQGKSARPPTWEELREGLQALRGRWDSGAHDGRNHPEGERWQAGERGDGGWGARRTREESFLAFQKALASGDEWGARNALRDLEQGDGELLSSEQLRELSGMLGSADRDLLRDLSRALAVAGGQ